MYLYVIIIDCFICICIQKFLQLLIQLGIVENNKYLSCFLEQLQVLESHLQKAPIQFQKFQDCHMLQLGATMNRSSEGVLLNLDDSNCKYTTAPLMVNGTET